MLATASYDPYGGIQGSPLGSFGFTGELQQGANVYLRARWYDAGRGRFTARDPFDGWGEQPYSLHPYAYGYADPVGKRDPSGRAVTADDPCARIAEPAAGIPNDQTRWTGDEIALSQCVAPLIFKYAAIHAMPGAGFDKNTMAALMAAIIQMENGNPTWDDWVNRTASPIANAILPMRVGGNKTVGIANMRPESVMEIYSCEVPLSNGKSYHTDLNPTYITKDMLDGFGQDQLTTISDGAIPMIPRYDNRYLSTLLTSNVEFALEMLAINLKRGIIRAEREGLTPSVLNVSTWHNSGIQHPKYLRATGLYPYGVGIATFFIFRAAQNLGIHLPPTMHTYNIVEGESDEDEQQFVNLMRCRQVDCKGYSQ